MYHKGLVASTHAGSSHAGMRQGGTLYFLVGDHLGSSLVVADASGALVARQFYRAYGGTRGTNPAPYQPIASTNPPGYWRTTPASAPRANARKTPASASSTTTALASTRPSYAASFLPTRSLCGYEFVGHTWVRVGP